MLTPSQREDYINHLVSTYNVPGKKYADRIMNIYLFCSGVKKPKYDFEFDLVSLPDVPKSIIIKHDERDKSLINALRAHKVPENKLYNLHNLLSRAILGEQIKSLDQIYAEINSDSFPEKADVKRRSPERHDL